MLYNHFNYTDHLYPVFFKDCQFHAYVLYLKVMQLLQLCHYADYDTPFKYVSNADCKWLEHSTRSVFCIAHLYTVLIKDNT